MGLVTRMNLEPRLFSLVRKGDKSGVSGTGRVLDGVLFHTGQVVICWRTDIEASKHGFSSLGIYPSWEAFEFIHVKSHPTNGTEVHWHHSDEATWFSGAVMCVRCSHRWVAVAPVAGETKPKGLQCPACREMTGYPTKAEA